MKRAALVGMMLLSACAKAASVDSLAICRVDATTLQISLNESKKGISHIHSDEDGNRLILTIYQQFYQYNSPELIRFSHGITTVRANKKDYSLEALPSCASSNPVLSH